jgi:phosphoadenosine phosphosulfate reductase
MSERNPEPSEQDGPSTRGREELARAASAPTDKMPHAILRWATEYYFPKLVVVSNFGPGTVVVIHHLAEVSTAVPVIHIDTGFQFPETLDVAWKLEERYGIEVQRVGPELTVEQQAAKHGPALYERDPDYCCYMRKVLPLQKALVGYEAWVSGIRASQTHQRQQANVVEWDTRNNMLKVNPLLDWSTEDVWEFIRKHDLPYNSLHDRDYKSVGCWPCTQPVKDGEEERAGRWSAFGKTECGIHLPQDQTDATTDKG